MVWSCEKDGKGEITKDDILIESPWQKKRGRPKKTSGNLWEEREE